MVAGYRALEGAGGHKKGARRGHAGREGKSIRYYVLGYRGAWVWKWSRLFEVSTRHNASAAGQKGTAERGVELERESKQEHGAGSMELDLDLDLGAELYSVVMSI